MAGRTKRSGSVSESKSDGAGDFQAKHPQQAVLLADSFKTRFRPITLERPKVLLPLCNVPMIEYTLEFLVSGGVQEIFVFCVAHAAQIKEYLDNSKWTKSTSFTVKCIQADSCSGPGDALRHLDTLDLIKGDFVLLSGDVVANFPLAKVLKLHKDRVKADKRNVATIVMKKAAPNHRTRTLDDDMTIALCADSGQLLQFSNELKEANIELSTPLLEERRAVEFRYDLMDCHIDIISPEGLLLFADNPDWFSRDHFINGILEDELLGNKITTHVIAGDYAARVQDLRTYDSVSKDIIQRWTFPLVPDNNLLGHTSYQYSRRNVYKETKDVNFARSCVIGENSVIGGGTTIGHNTRIDHSVIGPNCVIGTGVRITGSYLWGNCQIGDGVLIEGAIICDGVVVKNGAIITPGAILSFNVTIGPEFKVNGYTKLTTLAPSRWALDSDKKTGVRTAAKKASKGKKDDSDDDTPAPAKVVTPVPIKRSTSAAANSVEEVGVDGVGRVYPDDDPLVAVFNTIAPSAAAFKVVSHDEDDNLSDFDDDDQLDDDEGDESDDGKSPAVSSAPKGKAETKTKAAAAATTTKDDSKDEEVEEDDNTRRFMSEVHATLLRGHTHKMEVDGIILDMTSLQLSMHVTDTTYFTATFAALLSFVQGLPTDTASSPSSSSAASSASAAGASPVKAAAAAPRTSPTSASSSAAAAASSPNKASATTAAAATASPASAGLANAVRTMRAVAVAANQWKLTKVAMLSLKEIFKHWKLALTKFGKKTQAQQAMLHGLQAACLRAPHSPLYQVLFPVALQWLYDEDALTEDVIFGWEEAILEKKQPGAMALVKRAKVFLDWLREAEEEDESDDD